MNKINIIKILIMSVFLTGLSLAQDSSQVKIKKELEKNQKGNHKNFIDANGDGYNDNAPDHDGDGIPNGIDPDYIKLNKRENHESVEYIDSNGDGINDNLQFNGKGRKRGFNNDRFKNLLLPQNSDSKKNLQNGYKKNSKGKG